MATVSSSISIALLVWAGCQLLGVNFEMFAFFCCVVIKYLLFFYGLRFPELKRIKSNICPLSANQTPPPGEGGDKVGLGY